MSYVFKKIGATNILENAPAEANVICEVNGEVNRVPATGFSGIKVANIRAVLDENGSVTFSCDNMTYEEAVDYLTNGVPFLIFIFNEEACVIAIWVSYDGTSVIDIKTAEVGLKWTSAGFTVPGGGVK